MNINEQYLTSVKKQFEYYKTLAEKAMDQLEPEQLFVTFNEDSNSIAAIIKHLSGNMLSRWTDFLTTDGEKPDRNRDTEFEIFVQDKANILQKWNEGWNCFFKTFNQLKPEQLEDIVYIRNEGHTVIEAISRHLAHSAYHIGQIVFYAKQLKEGHWKSLSIPKNKSNDYNAGKFSTEKTIKNYTESELRRMK
jgi:predicted DNA-binding ArsR family transcriptional regulator